MKCTRKLASLLLALVMVFALATTAFASETVTPPHHRHHYRCESRCKSGVQSLQDF